MRNVAYIRVPKTGSNTLLVHLLEYIDRTRGLDCIDLTHSPASLYVNHPHEHDYITMVRDPLQLACSYYHFIKKRRDVGVLESPLTWMPNTVAYHKALDEGITLEEMLTEGPSPQFYEQFFAPLNLADFYWVGVLEDYETSVATLSSLFQLEAQHVAENVNPDKNLNTRYEVAADVEAIFKERNAVEYDYYAQGLARFAEIKAEHAAQSAEE